MSGRVNLFTHPSCLGKLVSKRDSRASPNKSNKSEPQARVSKRFTCSDQHGAWATQDGELSASIMQCALRIKDFVYLVLILTMKAIILSVILLALTSLNLNAQEAVASQADSLNVSETTGVKIKPHSIPGGEKRLKLSIKQNYRLPHVNGQASQFAGFSIVALTFVDSDGPLANFPGLGIAKVAQNNSRLLFPGRLAWQPGMNYNVAAWTQFTLPFSFVVSSTPKKETARQPFGGKKKEKKRKIWY